VNINSSIAEMLFEQLKDQEPGYYKFEMVILKENDKQLDLTNPCLTSYGDLHPSDWKITEK
jgi:hypothetical protein